MIHVIDLPIVQQQENYTCGTAVVKSILEHFDTFVSEEKLAKILHSNKKSGTKHQNIVNFINKFCYCRQLTNLSLSSLKKNIDHQHPVIVLLQAWGDQPSYEEEWEDGHYAIAIGYDHRNIYFMDPSSSKYTFIGQKEFENRWHDKDAKHKLKNFGIILTQDFPTKTINEEKTIKME